MVNIAVVDDAQDFSQILTRMLDLSFADDKIEFSRFQNGAELLNWLESNKVDLVLMDMQMPVMDGPSTIKKLREVERYKHTPIIGLTGATKLYSKFLSEPEFADVVLLDKLEDIKKIETYIKMFLAKSFRSARAS